MAGEKAYFFSGSRYVRYDVAADKVDPGYPRKISAGWAGIGATGFSGDIQASVDLGQGEIFFFRGAQYIKVGAASNAVFPGYPRPIAGAWPGLQETGFDRDLDAAANWLDGTAYLFKGSRFVIYHIGEDKVVSGPNDIASLAKGIGGTGFESGLDAVLVWPDRRVFMFKGTKYVKLQGGHLAPESPRDVADGWPDLARVGFAGSLSAGYVKVSSGGAGIPGNADDLSDAFFVRLKEVCAALGVPPEEMLAVMMSESSVKPWAQNPHGKATGLIQFMPATLQGLGWTAGPDAFKKLSAEEQLPYVQRYYQPYVRYGLKTGGRLYQATFLPATLPTKTQPEDVLAAPGGPYASAYHANTGLDTDRNGRITLGDLEARLQNVRRGSRWEALMARLG